MKTRLILDINKTQYAQLNSLVTGRVGDKASNTVDVYVVDGFIPYNLTGSDVYFECAKPDNTSVRDKNGITMIDAAKGHFEYTFPAQTFASVGKSKQAYFTVEKNSTVKATTQDFIIVSLPDALTNRIPSQTYISQLEELIWQLEQIELDLLNSAAYNEAHDAKTFAEQAKSISESVQEQLNQIVINGSIDPETKQARVDKDGIAYPLLKNRMDAEQQKMIDIDKFLRQLVVNVKMFGAKGDGITDDSAAIKSAIDFIKNNNVSSRPGGILFFPAGVYLISDSIKITDNISVHGAGGRSTVLKKKPGTLGRVLEFQASSRSWSFNVSFKDFIIEGTGLNPSGKPNTPMWQNPNVINSMGNNPNQDLTNDGFVINPYWGLDGIELDNVTIIRCGGYGMRIEPNAANIPTEVMVMQQSKFANLSIEYCNNGLYHEGFFGNIHFDSCTFETCFGKAFETGESVNGHSGQDVTFTNCAFQFSKIGIALLKKINNFNFVGCHLEENENTSVLVDCVGTNLGFYGSNFATTDIAIDFVNFNGACSIDNYTYSPTKEATVAQPVFRLSSTITGLVFIGLTQHYQKPSLVGPFVDPNKRIRGFSDVSTPTFKIDYININRGISSTETRSRNLAGRASTTNGSSTLVITFPLQELDNQYKVFLTPSWNTSLWVSNKKNTDFTVNFSTPPTLGQTIEWFIVR
ncbi:glycosyl hydrolase family 28-related protein [Bacillus thuringiensis]|uniref:glycosyl hydrolase family 28-related protein n=1 Tax=Bacillus thuringiensis TaxID=1428 RepID=UPI00159BB63B|nr:glycosyl hydrolase family 28-related protein [Bacillus thuringiensis]